MKARALIGGNQLAMFRRWTGNGADRQDQQLPIYPNDPMN
jgi:hypothetical protein